MIHINFFVAVVLLVTVFSVFFSDAFKLPMKHHPKSINDIKLATAHKLMQIHKNIHIRGKQPKGARLYKTIEEGILKSNPVTPMSDNTIAGSYTAAIEVGTPPQVFNNVVMDTGSSNFWIPDSTCDKQKYPECGYETLYNNLTSSTFVDKCDIKTCSLFLPYGSGTAFGSISMDKVKVGDADLPLMNFGRITALPGSAASWGKKFFDGILGLAWSEIAMPIGSNLPGPFEVMFSSGIIPKKMFSVYLSHTSNSTDSYVYFGGVPNDRHFNAPMITMGQPLEQLLLGYWGVTMKAMSIGGRGSVPVGSGAFNVLDTGTTLIAVPPKYADAIIPYTNVSADCSNVHALPDVTITLHGSDGQPHDFVLTPELYTYKLTLADGTVQCQNGFFSFGAGEGLIDLWILGDSFLKSFPAVFDMGLDKVSLVNPKARKN